VSGMSLNAWQIVALLGAVQGIVLALALAVARTGRLAHRLLAVAVLAFSIYLASAVYYTAGLVDVYPHFFGIAHPMPFLFGPLIYLYARCASDRSRRLERRDLWHFVPFLLVALSAVPIYAMTGSAKVALFHAISQGTVPAEVAVADRLKLVSGIAYSIATLRLIRAHQRVVADNYSSLERVNLEWLRRLALSGAAIWLLAIVFDLAQAAGIGVPAGGDQFIAVALTLLIYGIGYLGLRQPEIFRFATAEHPIPVPAPHPSAPAATPPLQAAPAAQPVEAPQRYERSGLSPRQAELLERRLQQVMADARPYRNPELTLADLAEQLGTTPHRLSEVLNGQLQVSFYDYVNGYRVREVQRRLTGPDGDLLKLLSLALDAGFASKSTFNAAFKKLTGQTPSEYRESATAGV
jgi:AraC-like DNA-binding protein